MTEAEWRTATDPWGILHHLARRGNERKLRLYCVEAVFPLKSYFFHPTSSLALAVAEEVAEGGAGELELTTARQEAWAAFPFPGLATTHLQINATRAAARTVETEACKAAELTSNEVCGLFAEREEEQFDFDDEQHDAYFRGQVEGNLFLANLLRDIFANPFRAVAFDPAWRTEATTGIAAKMYDERDFCAMPILADALEEAGCDNTDILNHCREPGTHVRGCWVVDLVLGKS